MHNLLYFSVSCTQNWTFFHRCDIPHQGLVSKICVLLNISNNMTGLAFYERSLAEKKEKFLPSFSSWQSLFTETAEKKTFSSLDTLWYITSWILLWKHLDKPGSKTAKAHSVLQQVMCCALFDSRACGNTEWLSSLHSAGAGSSFHKHLLGILNPWNSTSWTVFVWASVNYGSGRILLDYLVFDFVYKNTCHEHISWMFHNTFDISFICVLLKASQGARFYHRWAVGLKPAATAPVRTLARVFHPNLSTNPFDSLESGRTERADPNFPGWENFKSKCYSSGSSKDTLCGDPEGHTRLWKRLFLVFCPLAPSQSLRGGLSLSDNSCLLPVEAGGERRSSRHL